MLYKLAEELLGILSFRSVNKTPFKLFEDP